MTFSVDDFIVKIALQVDDSQLKQARKDIDALGLGLHNKASSRAENQNSEFTGPPQRVRQHAYDSDPDREGQGKDNLRNKRIRVQTALDFLRWPGIIAAGVTGIAFPLIKLYQLTERSFADLLTAVKGLNEKGVEANLSERDVRIVDNINNLTPLPPGEILKALTRVAQINAELIDWERYPGTATTLLKGESKGFYLNRTLRAPTAVDQLRELRKALKGLSNPQTENFATQFGLPLGFLSWLKNVSDELFEKQITAGVGQTSSQEELDEAKEAEFEKKRTAGTKSSYERRVGSVQSQLQIEKEKEFAEYIKNKPVNSYGLMDLWLKEKYLEAKYFMFNRVLDTLNSAYPEENFEDKHKRSIRTEQEDRENKKQPINMTLNINGQLKDGTMSFTEELMVNNTQTFIADIDGTA